MAQSLSLRDLANSPRAEELLDLNRALQQSNRIAGQLKTSLSLVLEREEVLAAEKEQLQKEVERNRRRYEEVREEMERIRGGWEIAKGRIEEGERNKEEIERLMTQLRNCEEQLSLEKQRNRTLSVSLQSANTDLSHTRQSHQELLTSKEELESLLQKASLEHQATLSKLRDQLGDSVRASKEQLHNIERKLQLIQSERSQVSQEKATLMTELVRLSEESCRKSEDRKRLIDMYEHKLKEANEELASTREAKETTAASLTDLLDRHEQLERDYQDAVFHAEELSAQLKASQISARQLEESLDQQNSRIRQAMTESTLKYEEQLSLSDSQRLRLQTELAKSQTIESERLRERAFFQKAIGAILHISKGFGGKTASVIESLNAISVQDAETLLKFIAKIPFLLSEDTQERRLRVIAKVGDSSIEIIEGKALVVGQKSYEFDRIFSESDKLDQVYEEVTLLTDAFAQGVSSCVYIFARNSFMFNNMVHRTLLTLFKANAQELLLKVTEGGEEPNYEQRVSSYAAASKVLEAAAKSWRLGNPHIALSLQQLVGKQVLSFLSVNSDDGEVAEGLAEALVAGEGGEGLPQHLQEAVGKAALELCILTLDSEETDEEILRIGQVLMRSRSLLVED